MSYQKLIENGLLKKEKIGFDQIIKVLGRARRDIKSARTLIKDSDEDGSFRFSYEAMLLAGRALCFSFGLKPRTIGSHKIIIDFVTEVIGKEYEALVNKFDKMRKKRNYLIYGTSDMDISKTEAENAIKTTKEFLERIEEIVHEKNPQKKLNIT
jgi:uncharacterized protein (UPF0332 family)